MLIMFKGNINFLLGQFHIGNIYVDLVYISIFWEIFCKGVYYHNVYFGIWCKNLSIYFMKGNLGNIKFILVFTYEMLPSQETGQMAFCVFCYVFAVVC